MTKMVNLTPDARCIQLSRRSFVAQSAAAAFCVAFPGAPLAAEVLEKPTAGAPLPASTPNAWVTFKPDGVIEVNAPLAEMGTGAMTAIAMYVAEELDADWKDIRSVTAPASNQLYGNPYFWNWQIAAGVRAALGYYDTLRLAGAQARYLLLTAAAARWSMPIDQLTTANSFVFNNANGQKVPYADLIADVVVPRTFPKFFDPDFQKQPRDTFFGDPPPSPVDPQVIGAKALPLKRRSEFKIIGTSPARLDLPPKVKGTARYGLDGHVEGMVYAMVLVAPQIGGIPDKVDDKAARAIKNIVDIVQLPYGVAVVGSDIFAVRQARDLVDVTWRDAPIVATGFVPGRDAKDVVFARYDSTATLDEFAKIAVDRNFENREPVRVFEKGDPNLANSILTAGQDRSVKLKSFEVRSELAYHAPIEPQNAIVQVAPDRKSARVWVGTQAPAGEAAAVAEVLRITPDKVEVTAIQPGGAFGRRCEPAAVVDAAIISSIVSKPVKVIWTREDDLRRNPFRQAMASRMEAAVDEAGKIVATRHTVVGDSWLARILPHVVQQAGGTDGCNWQSAIHPYDVPNQVVNCFTERRAVNVCFMRGLAAPSNKLCQEGLIDTLAVEQGADPLQFRLDLLKHEPRAQAVLRETAKMADWSRKRDGTQLGIAYSDYTNSHVAAVVELSVEKETGAIKIHHVWSALDVGMTVMPDGILAQAQGAIIMALSMALKEQVTIKDNVPQQSNFHDYPVIRMSEVPEIEIKVIPTDYPIAGAGELPMYPIASAINCAFNRITGKFMNKLPMMPEDVLKVMRA